LSDRQLTDLTGQAGAPDAGTCIAERRFEPWTRQVTDQASQAGINQTPTVLVNGKPLADTTAAGLRAAVNAAA
jgi:protein-disulfide isomerase